MEKIDVVIVGGGLAGLSCAYTLAGEELTVLVLERGDFSGSKNVTGGRIYLGPIRSLIPDLWEEAPFERHVTKEALTLMAEESSTTFQLSSQRMNEPPYPSYTILRSRFDRWFADKVKGKGAYVIPEKRVDDLIIENGRVAGVVAGEEEIGAEVVVAADGVLSFLAERAGLRKPFEPVHFAVGLKEVIQLPREKIEDRFGLRGDEGMAHLFVGSLTRGMMGGAFLGAFAPIFLLVTGNGLLLWFLINALIAGLFYRRWFRKAAANEGITHEDIGRFESIKDPESRDIIFRTIVLSVGLIAYLYVLVGASQMFFAIEFRYMWPVLKILTAEKFVQFVVNILPVFPFFLINGGVYVFGMMRLPESDSPLKTQMIWWIKIVFVMESTLLVMIIANYLPMFLFGTGPLLLMGLYGIFLMAYIPIFAGIFFLMTAFYIKTGRIYLGSIVATLLVVWIMTGGMLI